MNLAEKLAATYLRLNGFLLLPHFTVFTGGQHNHIDLIALRVARSTERVNDFCFPIDENLFRALGEAQQIPACESTIGIAAEVRTNDHRNRPSDDHVAYIAHFLGRQPVQRVAFFEGEHAINCNGDCLDVGMRYAGLWIQSRIDRMNEAGLNLTKIGSWNWSESFLADFLVLRQLGLLTDQRWEG